MYSSPFWENTLLNLRRLQRVSGNFPRWHPLILLSSTKEAPLLETRLFSGTAASPESDVTQRQKLCQATNGCQLTLLRGIDRRQACKREASPDGGLCSLRLRGILCHYVKRRTAPECRRHSQTLRSVIAMGWSGTLASHSEFSKTGRHAGHMRAF